MAEHVVGRRIKLHVTGEALLINGSLGWLRRFQIARKPTHPCQHISSNP